ncbi:MAG: EamA family transporter [Acidimicrobiia bacterium]
MGFILGIAAAAAFGGAAVLTRIGMRHRSNDDGVLMSIMVNVVVLGIVVAFAPIPKFDSRGILAFIAAGILGTFLGRSSNLRAVRIIGPARANAFLSTAPLVSGLGGWIILGESVGIGAAVGGVIVLAGLRIVMRNPGRAGVIVPESVPLTDLETPTDPVPAHSRLSGYIFATAGACFFGMAFVMRKLGIVWFPSAIVGAFLGAVSALVVVATIDSYRGRIGRRWQENVRSIPWWFVAAGVATSVALLLQFAAYFDLPAWTVSLLQGTQIMWTLLWSYVGLREEEHLTMRLFWGVLLVVIGVSIVALQV